MDTFKNLSQYEDVDRNLKLRYRGPALQYSKLFYPTGLPIGYRDKKIFLDLGCGSKSSLDKSDMFSPWMCRYMSEIQILFNNDPRKYVFGVDFSPNDTEVFSSMRTNIHAVTIESILLAFGISHIDVIGNNFFTGTNINDPTTSPTLKSILRETKGDLGQFINEIKFQVVNLLGEGGIYIENNTFYQKTGSFLFQLDD